MNIMKIKDFWNRRFGTPETYCGSGSYIQNTKETISWIQDMLKLTKTKSILDLGCGDWNWMKEVNLEGIHYTGIDLDEEFIEENKEKYPQHTFLVADALKGKYPTVDLVICRDLLLHLKDEDIAKILEKIINSKSIYFMTSSHMGGANRDFSNREKKKVYTRRKRPSRRVNLLIPPWCFESPEYYVEESSQNRIFGVWKNKRI